MIKTALGLQAHTVCWERQALKQIIIMVKCHNEDLHKVLEELLLLIAKKQEKRRKSIQRFFVLYEMKCHRYEEDFFLMQNNSWTSA